jgi:hypothetical protein
MQEDPNCVYETNGEIEAQQIKALLKAHDIPCEFKGEALRLVHGFTLDGLGVVRICVPAHLVEKARELLARADAGDLALPDEDD